MSAIISWFWVPSVRSSHVQQTWIWERMYGSFMHSCDIRMPCVRPSTIWLFHTHFFHLFFKNSPFVLWKYGRRIRLSSKYAHKPLQHQTQNKIEESQPTTDNHSKENDDHDIYSGERDDQKSSDA